MRQVNYEKKNLLLCLLVQLSVTWLQGDWVLSDVASIRLYVQATASSAGLGAHYPQSSVLYLRHRARGSSLSVVLL